MATEKKTKKVAETVEAKPADEAPKAANKRKRKLLRK